MLKSDRFAAAPLVSALVVSVLVFALGLLMWEQVRVNDRRLAQHALNEQAELVASSIESSLAVPIIAIQRMAERWENAGGTSFVQWTADA